MWGVKTGGRLSWALRETATCLQLESTQVGWNLWCRSTGHREEFSHTGRSHLNGAEMGYDRDVLRSLQKIDRMWTSLGYEADIGPRTNQRKPSLNHSVSPTFGPMIFTSYVYGNIKAYFLIRLPGRERSTALCNLNLEPFNKFWARVGVCVEKAPNY